MVGIGILSLEGAGVTDTVASAAETFQNWKRSSRPDREWKQWRN
jgi:hypothetical protein